MSQQLPWVAVCSLLLLCPHTGVSQQPQTQQAAGRITGIVAGEHGPLASAAVTVKAARDSTVVGGSMSSSDGHFRVDGLAFGKYFVRISYLGYKPHNVLNITLSRDTPQVDLGRMTLTVAPVALSGIEAQVERSAVVVQSDRTIYNTKQMPTASTGKAIDVLRNVSELEVDMNGKVTMRGNQPVAIHFDGRPAPLRGDALTNYLQQMPGNRIARVEVIPNPSAKYDPEGMGGIVNIVMKEGVDLGWSGSVSLNTQKLVDGAGLGRGAYTQLNYQKGRFTMFSGVGLNWNQMNYDMIDVRENLLTKPVTLFETDASSKTRYSFNYFDFTTELKSGKQGHFWFNGYGYGNDSNNDGSSLFSITDLQLNPLDRYSRDNTTANGSGTAEFSVGFKQVFQPMRHEFTIDLRRRHNGSDGAGESLKQPLLITSDGELTCNDSDGNDNQTSLQADYTRPLGEKGKLDAGLRGSWRDQESDANYWYYMTPTEDLLRYRTNSSWLYEEDLYSAYFTASRAFGKLNLQGGLRGERADTKFHVRTLGDSYSNDYTSLFPSGNVAYDFGKQRTLRVSYSKRVSRPYPYLLNPYNPSADTLNRYSGNPSLKPNYTHSYALDYTIVGKKLTLRAGPFYRKTVNNWDAIRLVDTTGISTITYKNIASIESYGGSFTASIRPTPTGKWGGSSTFTTYREIRDASNVSSSYSTNSVRWTLNANLMYKFSKTLTANTYGMYNPPRQMMQGRISAMAYTSLGMRKQFLNTKATWNLSIMDPFNLYHYNYKTTDTSHIQKSTTSFKQRMVMTSITYNFGRPPQQNFRKQQQEQQAETVQIR